MPCRWQGISSRAERNRSTLLKARALRRVRETPCRPARATLRTVCGLQCPVPLVSPRRLASRWRISNAVRKSHNACAYVRSDEVWGLLSSAPSVSYHLRRGGKNQIFLICDYRCGAFLGGQRGVWLAPIWFAMRAKFPRSCLGSRHVSELEVSAVRRRSWTTIRAHARRLGRPRASDCSLS